MICALETLAVSAGGKADGCARLLQAGFPVPEGFVVDAADASGLAEMLARWPQDCRFAVRSSALDEDGATHSFAGAHDTLLDVARDDVPAAVARCAASLYAPRAVAYRVQHQLPTHDLRMMVLVQRLVEPVVAGVAFTSDPFGESDEMRINAAWGHGEAVVSGWVEPDEIRLDRQTGAVRGVRVGGKRQRATCRDGHAVLTETSRGERRRLCLSSAQLAELATLLQRVHLFFGGPRDVEWCHDGRRFWLLQARPLTAMGRAPSVSNIEWTRANLVEIFPEVGSPQAVEANVRLLDTAMRGWYGDLIGGDIGPCATRICGRPWFNLSRLRALCSATGTDPATVLEGMGHTRLVEDRPPAFDARAVARGLPSLARMVARQAWVSTTLGRWFRRLERTTQALARRDPEKTPDIEAARVVRAYDVLALSAMRRTYALGGMTAWKMALESVLTRYGIEPEPFIHSQVVAGEPTVTAQQGLDLCSLAAQAREEARVRAWFSAVHHGQKWETLGRWREWLRGTRFRAAFEAFLARYGHRGPYESDWSIPRYAEDPKPLLFAVAQMVAGPGDPSPGARRARQLEDARAQWAQAAPRLSPPARRLVTFLVKKVRDMYRLRELNRSAFVRVEAEFRRWHLALAARFVQRGWLARPHDYFELYLDEVAAVLERQLPPAALAGIVARRRAEHDAWRGVKLPLYGTAAGIGEHLLGQAAGEGHRRDEQVTPAARWDRARGLCLSPGEVEAEVVVILSPHDFPRMKRGAVLVAPAVDPSWIPLFTLASAVIVEVGGTLSHAATVAREYGLPAVASIPDATRVLEDGDRVRVDAARGEVVVVSRAADVEAVGGG